MLNFILGLIVGEILLIMVLILCYVGSDKKWIASDFQSGKNFVGYEASARMSELVKIYPDLFIVSKVGRFRALEINWEEKEMINELCKIYEIKPFKKEFHKKGINIFKKEKNR